MTSEANAVVDSDVIPRDCEEEDELVEVGAVSKTRGGVFGAVSDPGGTTFRLA